MSPWGRGGLPPPACAPLALPHPNVFPWEGGRGSSVWVSWTSRGLQHRRNRGGSIIEKDLGIRRFKTHCHEIPALHNHGMGKLLVKNSLWGLSGKLGDSHQ